MKKLRQLRFSILNRDIAMNAAAHRDDVMICAANARQMSGEEWEQITPWGDFPNPAGLQRLNKRTGQQMVDAFNSLLGKAKNAIFGAPIFRGHPIEDPEHYPDDRRYGKILALEARDDGLYCKPAWNSLGEENKKEGYWLYPSGVWKFKRCPGGVIEPTELVSVGLTNCPVIKAVQPWAKNSRAANAGTRDGALKGWETRRRNGTSGAKNPRAVKALATMSAKKAGRKATKADKEQAGEKLEKKASKGQRAKALAAARAESDKRAAAVHSGTLETAQARLDASRASAKPPPLPAPKPASTSSSSGPGTHVHVHVAAPEPAQKRGFLGSLLDAFARPHIHDGGAMNSIDPYFPDNFYGRRRLVVTNARKNKPPRPKANAQPKRKTK